MYASGRLTFFFFMKMKRDWEKRLGGLWPFGSCFLYGRPLIERCCQGVSGRTGYREYGG